MAKISSVISQQEKDRQAYLAGESNHKTTSHRAAVMKGYQQDRTQKATVQSKTGGIADTPQAANTSAFDIDPQQFAAAHTTEQKNTAQKMTAAQRAGNAVRSGLASIAGSAAKNASVLTGSMAQERARAAQEITTPIAATKGSVFVNRGYNPRDKARSARETRNLNTASTRTNTFAKEMRTKEEALDAEGKEGLGLIGTMAYDVGKLGTQMAADAIANALVPGGGLASMAQRSFGQGVMQAEDEGAKGARAVLYGAGTAGIEVLTEKLGSFAKPLRAVYGKGAVDDVLQKLTETVKGNKVLKVLSSAAGEGAEEALSDALQVPLQAAVLQNGAAFDAEWVADTAYDALLGSVFGGLLGGGDVVLDTVKNRNRAADLDSAQAEQDAAENDAQSGDALLAQAAQEMAEGGAENQSAAAVPLWDAQNRMETSAQNNAMGSIVEQQNRTAVQDAAMDNGHEMRGTDLNGAADSFAGTGGAQSVAGVAQVLGKSGATVMERMYDESQEAVRYAEDMLKAYHAGETGGKLPENLSTATIYQTEAMYEAGKQDAAVSLAQEKAAAQYAKTAGKDSGLVYDEFVREAVESGRRAQNENGESRVYLTQKTAERVNSVAKALGVRVRFADSAQVGGGTANAQISGSDILVEKNNPNPVMFLIGHEVTHRMQELAPTEYRAFRDAMAEDSNFRYQVEDTMALYAEHGKTISYEAAMDEVTADYAGALLEDGALLDAFVEKHRENRTLLEKVRDAIRSVIAKLTGAEKRKAQSAEGKLTAALEAASQQAAGLQGKADGATMTTTRNSLKEDGRNGREEATRAESYAGSRKRYGQTLNGKGKDSTGRVRGKFSDAVGRYGGVNPSFGVKPVQSWVDGNTVKPAKDSVAYAEQRAAMEYGVPSFVVSDAVYAENKSGAPAFSVGGQIYFKETLPEKNRGMFAPHEITHVMRQVSYAPYLDFIERTPSMLNMSSYFTQQLLDHTAKHQGTTINDANPIRLYDELNATIYGHYAAGKMGNLEEPLRGVFYDFDAYIAELTAIHEQFKQHNMKEETENGIGQLHSEERVQAVQQVRETGELHLDLHKVSETDTARGTGKRDLPGVRGKEGNEKIKFSLKDGEKKSWRGNGTHSLKEDGRNGRERAYGTGKTDGKEAAHTEGKRTV